MKFALVANNNIVHQFIVYDGQAAYTAPDGLRVEQVQDWIRVGDVFNISQPQYVPSTADLLDALAAHCYLVQTGGIKVGDILVSTDDTSALKLTAAWLKAHTDDTIQITWITNNVPVVINAAQILALGDAVFTFEQKCYAVRGQLITNILQYHDIATLLTAFDAGVAA